VSVATNFHIADQRAGLVNMAGRDQHIAAVQHGTIETASEVRSAISELRSATLSARLDGRERAVVTDHLDGMDQAARGPQPDQRSIGERLGALASLLAGAGAFVSGGASLIAAVLTIGRLIGRYGAHAIRTVHDATGG
jgi:hypothetical protein